MAAVIAHPPADSWNIHKTTRSTADHWGQQYHSVAKLTKTASLNRQLQTTITLLNYAYYTKTPMMLIHDGPSPDRERPSIWQLPEVKTLTQNNSTSTTDIDLCQFGHKAKHTTRIVASHMADLQPSMQTRPHASRCNCNCTYYQPDHYTTQYNTFALPDSLNYHLAAQISNVISLTDHNTDQNSSYEGYLPLDPYFNYSA